MKSLFGIRREEFDARRTVRLSLFVSAVWAVGVHGVIAAEGPVTAVQEALKKQQLLSAEPTGVLDYQTRAALRRFQTQHALQPTGEIDTPTLEALQKQATAPPPTEKLGQSREPVKTMVAEDHEFLKRGEKPPTAPTASTSQPAAPESAPPPVVPPPPPPAPAPGGDATALPVSEAAAPQAGPPSLVPAPQTPPTPVPPTSDSSTLPKQPAPLPPAEPEKSGVVGLKPEVPKKRRGEKRRDVAAEKTERAPIAETTVSATRPPSGNPASPATTGADSEHNLHEPVARGEKRSRPARVTTRPVDRNATPGAATTAYSGTPGSIPVRRAEAVEPRRREGFFDRLFKDD